VQLVGRRQAASNARATSETPRSARAAHRADAPRGRALFGRVQHFHRGAAGRG
jgi:hypothetical protein